VDAPHSLFSVAGKIQVFSVYIVTARFILPHHRKQGLAAGLEVERDQAVRIRVGAGYSRAARG